MADCVNLLFHVARITTTGLVPKAKDTVVEAPKRNGPLFKEPDITESAVNLAGWGDHQSLELMQD